MSGSSSRDSVNSSVPEDIDPCGSTDPALRIICADRRSKQSTLFPPPPAPELASLVQSGELSVLRRPVFQRVAGRYRLRYLIGAGAMGEVYEAYDPELDRRLAIKILRRSLDHRRSRERLLREARAMAKLAHPNVVQIFDAGITKDETVFVAMELVHGTNMKTWLALEPRSWRAVLGVMKGAGRGLAATHHAGLVHRDFKPSNVLVDAHGQGRVVDFGVVRWAREGRLEETGDIDSGDDPRLTGSGGTVGTPAYMAPEQRRGHADARSDQFSFAVSLHESLYGHRPGEPAPTERKEKTRIPRWLSSALSRALSERPEDRFPDMDSFLLALEEPSSKTRRRAALLTAALGLTALASVSELSGAPGGFLPARNAAAVPQVLAPPKPRATPLDAALAVPLWYTETGHYAEALRAAEKAVADLGASRDDKTPSRAELVLAWTFEETGDYKAARKHAEKAILAAAAVRDLRAEAIAWLSLARIVGVKLGASSETAGLLKSMEAALLRAGRDPAFTAAHSAVKGQIERARGNFALALQLFAMANHPHLGSILGPFAAWRVELDRIMCLAQTGQNEAAFSSSRDLRERAERNLGPQHPVVGEILVHHAAILSLVGKRPFARPYAEASLELWRRVLGAGHPLRIYGLLSLAEAHASRRDVGRAMALAQQALTVAFATLDREHPQIAHLRILLGELYLLRGAFTKAETMCRAATEGALPVAHLERAARCLAELVSRRTASNTL